MQSNPSILFEDIFRVQEIDKDGKKFDRVSRIFCRSETYEMEMILDVNTEIYPVDYSQKFTVAIAKTLNLDGTPDEGTYDQTDKKTLLDDYGYAMYGKVFKYTSEKAPSVKVSIYVSFGGLLMMLKGDQRNLQGIELDARIYLLMRRVS